MDNFIEIYEKAVSADICNYFIRFFEKQDKLGNTWSGTMGGGHVKKSWKNCTDLNIRRDEKVKELKEFKEPAHLKMLGRYEKIVDQKFAEYFKKYNTGLGIIADETTEMKFYSCRDVDSGPLMHRYEPPEEGFQIWHADWGPWGGSPTHRMVVGMLYLNDVHEGGETEFYHQQLAVKPTQGTIVVWPAYFTHTHRGNPPVSNTIGGQMSFNSKLVNPREFNSYRDFLNPRWKGKIVSLDPTLTTLGLTYLFPFNHPELGPEFVKRLLTSMDITFSRNIRQTTDWLARGKFALCLGCKDITAAKKQGLPVDTFDTRGWKEGGGLNTNPGTLSLVNQAPHPNAAKVFINWLLSRNGQIAFQKFGGGAGDPFNSGRTDIPKEGIPPEGRPMKGEKYVDLARPKYADTGPFFSFVKEIMRESRHKR